ncbi:putative oxysterol-binding protein 1A [Penaeus vannamei]|uniref:Oxysterol-binding protein n=1 Tax=Penaeus vannamei TaxID=6689 RepID=A0A423SG18_PENVA|nr:putative oxysterol-binding protein 1A [Penaeus vannamei]
MKLQIRLSQTLILASSLLPFSGPHVGSGFGREGSVTILPIFRTSLPAEQFQRNDFSLWSVLKQCIGKELSKITMPVVFNEPLSFLQRMAEYMEYAWLLEKADQAQDPVTRMQYVTAFAVSGLASNWERVGKPFNPLLGETYELQRDNYRIVCEQVSHHPPVSAFYADAENWNFHGSIHPKLKFWGKSVEIQPKGVLTVELPNHGEAYTWSNVNCCVHNIIVGKLWIEQYGTMEITNHATGHKSVLTFKTAGWFSKDLHRIEGFIMDKKKKKLTFMYGKWTEFLRATDIGSYEEYMKTNPHKFRRNDKKKSDDGTGSASPAHAPRKNGDIDGAANEKNRLEEKQREARKARKKGKEDWKPRWFEQGANPFTRLDDWLYSGGYWDRNYEDAVDIF